MNIRIYRNETTGFSAKADGPNRTWTQKCLAASGLVNNSVEISDVGRFEEWICQNLISRNEKEGTIEELIFSNEFTASNFKLLKEALSQTTHLKKLVFSSSAHTANNAHLFEGIANNNSITELTATLDRAVRPTDSDFSDWKQLSEALVLNKSIKVFTLKEVLHVRTPVEFDPNATLDFFNILTNNNTLTKISTYCIRSTKEIKSLAEGLKHNRSVSSLVISGCTHWPQVNHEEVHDITALEECLRQNTALKEILLGNANLDSQSLQQFLDALEVSSVESLHLRDVSIIGSMDPLFQFLKTTKTLRRFYIGKSATSTLPAYEDLVASLCVNTSVTNLELTGAGITHSIQLGDLIRSNKTIKSLSIGGKSSPKVWQAVEKSLQINDTLTHLHIHCYDQTSYSALLKKNKSIRSVAIYFMRRDDLLQLINTNNNLRKVAVYTLPLGGLGFAPQLKEALESNYTLTSFTIGSVDYKEFSQRNYDLMKRRYEDTTMIIHIIARSHWFNYLPREIWHSIFSDVTYPGLGSFELSYSAIVKHNKSLRSLVILSIQANDLLEIISSDNNVHKLCVHIDANISQISDQVIKALENNYVLTKVKIPRLTNCDEFSQRNYDLMKRRYEDTTMIIHIIARTHLFNYLPHEIWYSIFSYVTFPGLESFKPHVKSIFNLYSNK